MTKTLSQILRRFYRKFKGKTYILLLKENLASQIHFDFFNAFELFSNSLSETVRNVLEGLNVLVTKDTP